MLLEMNQNSKDTQPMFKDLKMLCGIAESGENSVLFLSLLTFHIKAQIFDMSQVEIKSERLQSKSMFFTI